MRRRSYQRIANSLRKIARSYNGTEAREKCAQRCDKQKPHQPPPCSLAPPSRAAPSGDKRANNADKGTARRRTRTRGAILRRWPVAEMADDAVDWASSSSSFSSTASSIAGEVMLRKSLLLLLLTQRCQLSRLVLSTILACHSASPMGVRNAYVSVDRRYYRQRQVRRDFEGGPRSFCMHATSHVAVRYRPTANLALAVKHLRVRGLDE